MRGCALTRQEVGLPNELFFERDGLKGGRFRPLYNFLVTLYFLHQVAADHNFNADFAHPIEGVISQYLQSRAAIDTMVLGGACEASSASTAQNAKAARANCTYPLHSPSVASSCRAHSPGTSTRTQSPGSPPRTPASQSCTSTLPSSRQSGISAQRTGTRSSPPLAVDVSEVSRKNDCGLAAGPGAPSWQAAQTNAMAVAAFEHRMEELRTSHEEALLKARAQFERELQQHVVSGSPDGHSPLELLLKEEVRRLRKREEQLLRQLQQSKMQASTAMARAAVAQQALQRMQASIQLSASPQGHTAQQQLSRPAAEQTITCPVSVDGELRHISFQMKEGETPEVVAREMIARLRLGGGANKEKEFAASIRAAQPHAAKGAVPSLLPAFVAAPSAAHATVLSSLYPRDSVYVVEEEDEELDEEGDGTAMSSTEHARGLACAAGGSTGEKSPAPIPRTYMLPVEEPGADEFLFYEPGEPRTPPTTPALKQLTPE
mmetsp:Transcript_29331/g.89818  ORF Transcript_29331/g.89818 Transcript_29331/m.89818 type:complete len:490 (+) Transcript_29331:694-2163(+)